MSKGLKALKEYRAQQQGVNVYADELLDIVEKELKALEIIKEKGLSMGDIAFIENGYCWESYAGFETMQAQYWGYEDKLYKTLKTKEEYELLKEALE